MNLEFMTDWAFWLVLFSIAIGFVLTAFFFPQIQQNRAILETYKSQEDNRIVVYIYAKTYEDALKELDKYLRNGWNISTFDYDTNKKAFIFVLRKGE